MDKLGITGRGTANDRLRDAEERGFLKLVDPAAEYGRTSARHYKIGKTSEEIARDIEAGGTLGVFPSPDDVLLQVQIGRRDRTGPNSKAGAHDGRPARVSKR
jgi:hypothetical protein